MEKILIGGVVGFTLLTLLSYVFIILHVPFLIIPVFLILTAILVIEIKKVKLTFNLQTFVIFIVFTIGIIGQMAVISPSGTFQNGNLVFWSAHGHDATWHIALMEEIKNGYPFQNPIFAGEKLINYHFFSDILPAMASKYLPISNLDLYFRIFPFFYSLFLGASAYFLTKKLTNNFSASIWATIFTYFAGSFGYLIGKGESVFWATQIQSSSGNPPQIVSDFLFLTALYFLLKFLQNKRKLTFAICVLLFGTISAFKIYAGVVLLGALGITSIWQIIREKDFKLLFLTILSGILAAILYFPNTSGGASFLIWEPWWYIRTMIVEPSRLNLLDWELRRQTYIYENNWKRVIWLEGLGFLIFFFGNLGMRALGLWEFFKSKLIIKVAIIISIIFPLLFLQKGVASNTAQFLQYFILLFGILAGITTSQLTNKFKFMIPIIIILMVPTQINLLREFYFSDGHLRLPFTQVSKNELQALDFIKHNSEKHTVILTPPYNQDLNLKSEIPNIWDWSDTGYVAAISDRRTYFDDYEQADIMGYDYKSRLAVKKIIFESDKPDDVQKAFAETHANLLYFPKILRPKVDLNSLHLTKFFENQDVEVWKAN
jgi:hypothetical protein